MEGRASLLTALPWRELEALQWELGVLSLFSSKVLNLVPTKDAQTTGAEEELTDIAYLFLGITLEAG